MTHHLPSILRRVQDAGHKVFTTGDYNLNIVGVRTASRTSDTFDDNLFCVYRVAEKWKLWHWYITSDPGVFYRENPLNVKGTAILCAGQHRGAWRFGLHRNKYEALVQHKPVKVWRDSNRDSVLDLDVPFRVAHEGLHGINFHRSSTKGSTKVGKWSAGCQVFAHPQDYIQFLGLCSKQIENSPDQSWMTFTYTLLED